MTHKVYIVTDLGPGDGGKGGVVHKITQMTRAHTIVKRGGAQGSHGVRTSKGEEFAFSQWGCGTFDGVPTHLSEQMIISPVGLLNEADALRYHHGIYDPFSLLTIDEEALCATPFHGIASRVKEMSRGENPRGTIGTGVGEAYRGIERAPELAIKARDLKNPELRTVLAAIREHVRADLSSVTDGKFLAEDRATVDEEVSLLYDDEFLDYVVTQFKQVSELARVVSHNFLRDEILSRDGVVVVETSHGVLTDRLVGFHPHTSAIRTLPSFTHGMLEEAGYKERVINIGVARAYAIRHGAGPMPTDDPGMAEHLLPGSHKDTNRYQGEVRVGPLDLVLLRYALAVCSGPNTFDGLAITWMDQIQANQVWKICDRYVNVTDSPLFSSSGEIRIKDSPSLRDQEELGQRLSGCQPEVEEIVIDPASSRDSLYDLTAAVIKEKLQASVRMVSFGPTELDKLCK